MKTVLSIAGSDSIGGAGIQADIKTITAFQLYAETALTAVTAQNTTGVLGVVELEPDFVSLQIKAIFEDIRPDAVKIGMVGSADIVNAIADSLEEYKATNIVVDPVMVATTGSVLMADEAVQTVIDRLLPLAAIITPNIPEAEVLSQMKIMTRDDMSKAAAVIGEGMKGAVLVKGGHAVEGADDLLLTEHRREVWLSHKRINTPNTHGTGCTLSSAIACGLAQSFDLQASVSKAKNYISGALENDPEMGVGSGPLDHMWQYR